MEKKKWMESELKSGAQDSSEIYIRPTFILLDSNIDLKRCHTLKYTC